MRIALKQPSLVLDLPKSLKVKNQNGFLFSALSFLVRRRWKKSLQLRPWPKSTVGSQRKQANTRTPNNFGTLGRRKFGATCAAWRLLVVLIVREQTMAWTKQNMVCLQIQMGNPTNGNTWFLFGLSKERSPNSSSPKRRPCYVRSLQDVVEY